MTHVVHIHADESCLGNQFQDRENPGAAAGLVEWWKGDAWVRRDYWISEPATTNNRMALRSAIVGLSSLRKPCGVLFHSDSQYLVKGMNEWVEGWRKRGWKRKAGPIENLELWQELVREEERHQVRWQWVRGHAGHPQNEYANHLATRAARALDASEGLVESGYGVWLAAERERRRYLEYDETLPPAGAGRAG
jgi:ribonuclease HI